MIQEKRPAMTDDEIIRTIDLGIGQSVGFSESKLAKEFERVQFYYDGSRPRKSGGSDSGYNSLDVYDGVEDMKAQLLDTFSANKRPVKFDPANGEDIASAKIRTDYVSWVLFHQNRGYKLFQETIDQALLSRNGIVKVWWEPKVETEYVYLSTPNLQEITAYLQAHADEQAEVVDMDMEEDGVQIKRARVSLKRDAGSVKIALLAPEEFGISPMSVDIKTADLVFHRHEMTVSDLIKAGYDKKTVQSLQSNDRLWLAMEPQKIARFLPTDDLIGTKALEDGSEARRVIMVYECYLELDLEDTGESQLFKVTKVGNTILDKEPVSRKPFVVFCPLPRPKAFWGHNFAKLLIATQNARTYLTRSIINHAMVTNNPRLQVVKGAVLNPKELTENRFGGIVNVTRPNGIIPLEQAPLNPFVFQTINLLKSDKEEKIGISDLSQGLNKDAVSKQNSADMIHELISVSQLRQKIVARNFAEGFLTELYNEIYRLVLENEKREKIVQIAGGWQPIDFSQWPEESCVSVSFALGYGEAAKEAEKWAGIGKALGEVPSLAGWFTPEQQYYVAKRGIEELIGPEVDQVLRPFNQPQPPPPNPLQQAEIQMKQADAQVKQANAQVAVVQAQAAAKKADNDFQLEMARLAMESRKLDMEFQLKRDQLAHKVAVDAAEITLQQDAQANDKLMAEAQPTRG